MNQPSTTLGRLEKIDARTVWPGEATHFTPWLALPENLELLGETIGIDLEFEAQEKAVGPFSADILCRDTATDDWVLIENQLEQTDHVHLGQVLTYASGLKAVTIVWIAKVFREEHRAALDWLNDITDDRFNFFGLEVEVWRIGESAAAPKFNVVSKPNDWSRDVTRAASRTELTAGQQRQLRFWTGFHEYMVNADTGLQPRKPQPYHWMTLAIGRTGFKLYAIASNWDSADATWASNEIRAEFAVDHDRSKELFAQLESERAAIDEALGFETEWDNRAELKTCRIFARRSADLGDEDSWDELYGWLLAHLNQFDRVLRERVRTLSLPDVDGSETNPS